MENIYISIPKIVTAVHYKPGVNWDEVIAFVNKHEPGSRRSFEKFRNAEFIVFYDTEAERINLTGPAMFHKQYKLVDFKEGEIIEN